MVAQRCAREQRDFYLQATDTEGAKAHPLGHMHAQIPAHSRVVPGTRPRGRLSWHGDVTGVLDLVTSAAGGRPRVQQPVRDSGGRAVRGRVLHRGSGGVRAHRAAPRRSLAERAGAIRTLPGRDAAGARRLATRAALAALLREAADDRPGAALRGRALDAPARALGARESLARARP